MAPRTAEILDYAEDDFSDLISFGEIIEDDAQDGAPKPDGPIDIDDALSEVRLLVADSEDFMLSDIFTEWEDAEEFYDGKTDVPKVAGRSQITKTVVRDCVRSLKPSILRVFVQSDHIVEYTAVDTLNNSASAIAYQQTKFVNQLFWRSDGYRTLYNAVHNALLKKVGIVKAYYKKSYKDDYFKAHNVSEEQLVMLQQMDDVIIIDIIDDGRNSGVTVELAHRKEEGKLCFDHVPLFEFFVDDNATTVDDARIIGQRRNYTVSDVRAMGLEYDGDWLELDPYDVEDYEAGGESESRRGYNKDHDSDKYNMDPANHTFLLTEAYMRFDLDGTGISQLYRFWLGGTSYRYIHHERVEEHPYSAVQIDPQPDAFFGKSIYDILKEDQNAATSLLRATADNAHLSNDQRLAFHETLVNQEDVMSKEVGHPIRFRQAGMIQPIGVAPMVSSMLPLLQYMDTNSEDKVGVTSAAMGLDPDALQSTDKEAVRNTIQLAGSQIELMVRNLAETGLRQVFDKLLRLSIRHNPRNQVIAVNGSYVPVDQYMFAPEMPMTTKVGLGQPDTQMMLSGLGQIYQEQKAIAAQYGLSNPMAGIQQMYNTLTDMASIMGIKNLGRYINPVDANTAQQLDTIAKQQAEAARTEKPSEGIAIAERIRADARVTEQQLENQRTLEQGQQDTRTRMIELMMKDDLERDKMAQDLAIEDAKIQQTGVDKAFVEFEQAKQRDYAMQQFMAKQAADREKFIAQYNLQEMQLRAQAQQQKAAQASAAQQPQQPM